MSMNTVAVVLAQVPPTGDQGGQGEDFGKSSPVGLVLLILFGIAVVFLVRSMTKHLKKLPTSFDEAAGEAAAPARARRSAESASATDVAQRDAAQQGVAGAGAALVVDDVAGQGAPRDAADASVPDGSGSASHGDSGSNGESGASSGGSDSSSGD